jgi:hypothetical protein
MLALNDITAVGGNPLILDTRLAELLGFSRERDIRKMVAQHTLALRRFGEVRATAAQTSPLGGRPGRAYWLNRKQALYLCAKSETPNAAEVTIQMVEVFDEWLDRRRAAAPAPAEATPTWPDAQPFQFGRQPECLFDMSHRLNLPVGWCRVTIDLPCRWGWGLTETFRRRIMGAGGIGAEGLSGAQRHLR